MTIPTDPPCDVVQLVRLERARLLAMLRSLSAEDWQRATPCPGWDVLGLVTHLVGDDLGVIAWQRDHHHGTPAPDGVDETTFIDWLDALQIEWVRAARRITPRPCGRAPRLACRTRRSTLRPDPATNNGSDPTRPHPAPTNP